MKARRVNFTKLWYTKEDEDKILNSELFSYVIFKRDISPGYGLPMLKGYGELVKQMKMAVVKKEIGVLAKPFNELGWNLEYYKKGEFFERGTPRGRYTVKVDNKSKKDLEKKVESKTSLINPKE